MLSSTLPEWSKGMDSSSTNTSCVGSILLVILGPIVWVDILDFEKAIFPYKYPALFSVSISFLIIYIVSKYDKESSTLRHEQNFNKMYTSSYLNLK